MIPTEFNNGDLKSMSKNTYNKNGCPYAPGDILKMIKHFPTDWMEDGEVQKVQEIRNLGTHRFRLKFKPYDDVYRPDQFRKANFLECFMYYLGLTK